MTPPAWWQHSSISFCWCLPSLSVVLACPFDTPGPFLVSLSCPICVSSATTCPALWSRSSGSINLQHKGILQTAGLLCVVTITSLNNLYVDIIAIISGNSTAHCIVWSPQAPCYVESSFAELSTPKPLRWSHLFGNAPLKSISFFVHCQKQVRENRPLPGTGHFKRGPTNLEEAAWSFRKGWVGCDLWVGTQKSLEELLCVFC